MSGWDRAWQAPAGGRRALLAMVSALLAWGPGLATAGGKPAAAAAAGPAAGPATALAAAPAGKASAGLLVAPGSAAINGTWAMRKGHERLIFRPDGSFRSCWAPGHQGDAAIGSWSLISTGRYQVEYTHVAPADCREPARALRPFKTTIVGQVRLEVKGELALYLGGEFPPEIYQPLNAQARR